MKKTLIALTVAGLSFNAMAVNLDGADAATLAVQKYASELKVPNTGLELEKVVIKANTLGFALSGDAYIRLNFSNDAEVSAVVAESGQEEFGSLSQTWSVASTGKGFVILKKDTAGTKANDKVEISLTAKLASKLNTTVKYDLYETAGNAVGQTGSLANKPTVDLLTFASGIKFTVKASAAQKKIDVTNGSTSFVGAPIESTELVSLAVAQDATVLGSNGAAVADLTAGGVWKVDGPFVVGTEVGDVDGTLVAIDKDNVGKQIIVPAGIVSYVNADAKVLSEGVINAEWVANSATLKTFNFGTYKFDSVTKLVKNGDKAEVNLALNPNGAYSQYVRISNKSAQAGAVFVTVIADDGKAANFPLSAIAGQPASLDAGASTVQMTLKDIYAAAEAKGLTLTGDKKIRLLVDAQIPEDYLSVQSYTLSKDGNSFATMNAF